jgi:signal transduction histidine kinase
MAERAQRIGAAFQVHSLPGRGSCVRLTLPATPQTVSL